MKRIIGIEEYKGKCERLLGFKKLVRYGIRTPCPIKIITHDAFEEYRKKGMTGKLRAEITASLKEIKSRNPEKGVIARRGYHVPGMQSPPGPRSSIIENPETIVQEIKKIFNFALAKKYDVEGSEITAFMHPFINPTLPMAGGNVTIPITGNILVEAIYGNDEGVLTLPHDSYWVDLSRLEITRKEILRKTKYMRFLDEKKYGIADLPEDLRARQVLDDEIILGLAKQAKKLARKYRGCRLEFDIIEDEIYFTECSAINDTAKTALTDYANSVTGIVTKVNSKKDLEKIKSASIICIGRDVEKNELMDIVTILPKKISPEAVVLFPGGITSHPSIILRECGVKVVHTAEEFIHGERIRIGLDGNKNLISRIGGKNE